MKIMMLSGEVSVILLAWTGCSDNWRWRHDIQVNYVISDAVCRRPIARITLI